MVRSSDGRTPVMKVRLPILGLRWQSSNLQAGQAIDGDERARNDHLGHGWYAWAGLLVAIMR